MMEIVEIQEQLDEKWQIFWWALTFGLITAGLAWRRGFFRPLTSNKLPVIQGMDVIRGFGLFLTAEIVGVPLLAGLFFTVSGTTLNGHSRGWLTLLLVIGGFFASLIAYLCLSPQQRIELWRQKPHSGVSDFGIGVSAWFIAFPLVMAFSQIASIVMWHLFHHPFVEQSVVITLRDALEHPFLFGVLAVAIVTLVPLTEEFLFRGLLQSWLKRKFKRMSAAVVVASAVFALFHFSFAQGIGNVEILSSLFLLSCMLGFLFERQRSLWAPVGLHSFFNFISLFVIFKD